MRGDIFMKRHISILLITILLLSIIPINVFAEEPEIVIESVEYNKGTKRITITGTAQCETVIFQVWTTVEPRKMIAFGQGSSYLGAINIIINNNPITNINIFVVLLWGVTLRFFIFLLLIIKIHIKNNTTT